MRGEGEGEEGEGEGEERGGDDWIAFDNREQHLDRGIGGWLGKRGCLFSWQV